MFQHVEVIMLHHSDDLLWYTTRYLLGMYVCLYSIHTHLGDHSIPEVYGDPAGYLQEMFSDVLRRLPRAIL